MHDGVFKPSLSSKPPSEPPSYEASEAESSTPTRVKSPDRPSLLKTGRSASSVTVQLAQASKLRNQPYKPLKEQQAHIDSLGDNSINALTTFSSGTKTEYFDVLPSFQMFQSILKRNDFEFDEDILGQPPQYGDTTTSPSPPMAELSPQHSSRDIDGVLRSVSGRLEAFNMNELDEEEEEEGRYLFSDNENEDGLQRTPRPRHRSPEIPSGGQSRSNSRHPLGPVTHESYGHSVLDNIDKLPHSRSSPLAIEIFVTKDVPVPSANNELETKLKEYSCGDVVNGYIIITNNSDEEVDFGLFTVSLECTVKAIYQAPESAPNQRQHRILLKKLMKMYDLNASYNYGVIPSSAGIQYGLHEVDTTDGTIMGLPNDRILKANLKYKKFITFKFPEMFLDNSCPHNVLRHTMPPPSFGIDNTAFYDRASTININKALGYGFLNYRGTPVKVRDYAFDDISVSYTIEAKFIDKQHAKDQKVPVDAHDINETSDESKYIISKSSQYFLRFVPDIKAQVNTYSRTYKDFRYETFDTVGIDGMLFGTLVKRATWKFIKFMNSTLEQEIQNALDKREFSGDQIKRKNLFSGINEPDDNAFLRPSVSNLRDRDEEQIQYYMNRKMLSHYQPVEIFGKKKKRLLLTSVKVGVAKLYAQVPDKLISYGAPRLIQRYNDGVESSESLRPMTSSNGFGSLHTVVSNMGELYNRDDESVLKSVKIEIVFDSLESSIRPPSISLIECNMVAWSYRTDYPIPVSFEHDFFYTKPEDEEWKLQTDDVENTKLNLQNLKVLVNRYIDFLKETKTFISQNTYSYLKGLSKLGAKKDSIKEYFQTLLPHSHPHLLNEESWVANQLEQGKIRWTRELEVPLKVLNKHNITLPPSFQSCLVGRLYCLQIVVKFKGADEPANVLTIDVPVLVG